MRNFLTKPTTAVIVFKWYKQLIRLVLEALMFYLLAFEIVVPFYIVILSLVLLSYRSYDFYNLLLNHQRTYVPDVTSETGVYEIPKNITKFNTSENFDSHVR